MNEKLNDVSIPGTELSITYCIFSIVIFVVVQKKFYCYNQLLQAYIVKDNQKPDCERTVIKEDLNHYLIKMISVILIQEKNSFHILFKKSH